jgi:hypothetical protein
MNALSQEARALIDSVSAGDEPAVADKTRVRLRLAAELGSAAFATLALAGATQAGLETGLRGAASAAQAKGVISSLTAKLVLSSALLSVIAGALWLWPGADARRSEARHLPTRAASAQAVPLAVQPRADDGSAAQATEPAKDERAAQPVALSTPQASARKRGARAAKPEAAPEQAAADGTLGLELGLLREAQAALRRGAPERALQLAAEHQARFPAGVMKEERLGIEALAGCALGRDYRAQAETFLRLLPSSPLAARVQKACGLAQ